MSRATAFVCIVFPLVVAFTTTTEWLRVFAVCGVAFTAFFAGRTWEMTR